MSCFGKKRLAVAKRGHKWHVHFFFVPLPGGGIIKLNYHRLKPVGCIATESRIQAKACSKLHG